MPIPAIATLPGAPLALADLTGGLHDPPPELTDLRHAVAAVVAGLGSSPCLVVCPAERPSVWRAGDLGLAGFGTGDPPRPWAGGAVAKAIAARFDVDPRSDDIPTEGRVVARQVKNRAVAAIIGIPVASPRLARTIVDAAAREDHALVAVGDLSASVGPSSPRPGRDPRLDDVVVGGVVNRVALGRHLAGPDGPLASALQVLLVDGIRSPHGSVHVVRGVGALVALGT